jgi:hypothetical protein
LDLNATRIQALRSSLGDPPQVIPLEESCNELPLVISLEHRHPVVGQAGLFICRSLPHLVCQHFLPELGGSKVWTFGRRRLDATTALNLVFERIHQASGAVGGAFLSLPPYLSPLQMDMIRTALERNRFQVMGFIRNPLAAALAAYSEQSWAEFCWVFDVDDYALSISLVENVKNQARKLATRSFPRLGLRFWKESILNSIAERCVRQSRRDPRDSANAEQSLWQQIDSACERTSRRQMADLVIQTSRWCQNLVIRPEEMEDYCSRLIKAAITEFELFRQDPLAQEKAPIIVMTETAVRLPGLQQALEEFLPVSPPAAIIKAPDDDDFGDSLWSESPSDLGDSLVEVEYQKPPSMCVLTAESGLRASHVLAEMIHRRDLPAGEVMLAPLPPPLPVDAGPVRLRSQNQDYHLGKQPMVIGRHPSCDIIFDSYQHPTVSARHCEVVPHASGYRLRDFSRNGTFVNDQPIKGEMALKSGDWIRLGPGGPQLRFLGKPIDQRKSWSVVS